ncbi:cyclohexanone monooxygenase [Eremomyces bilateralis CBS 781.70]|uniref:Cyclohexanone monooxygenase n=1 Tax=Eremomyces bilateralis CBS 781.70 TaxID=1392243 RepID=A0A6G1GFR5_9PEZI|nr:cyclohexanone monooxygenase [Eremomyces bilateralis CBS 781.70]KAF1816927.1 cyclohexanone monooxygenase [Eremomyces bilateralis CBS 781.70]
MGSSAPIDDQPYSVPEQWHSQPGYLRVICAGAGAAGLCVAYKMKHMKFINYDLVCYEKNPEVGGTWYENRYPGCACDVPAHAYTYSFEPNPNWSSFYAYAPEIRQYFEDFAQKHGLMPNVQLNSRILSARWREEKGIYNVEVESNGKITQDWCHVFINGTGFLNHWKWPDIEGLHSFKGTLMHSANWDPEVDWTGKRVAVVGTGSSAIQMVPQIQRTASHLTCFMRSVTWISPPVAGSILDEDRKKTDDGHSSNVPHGQHFYSEEEKESFRTDPDYHLEYRRNLEGTVNKLFDIFIDGSPESQAAQKTMKAEMLKRIGPGHEDLKKRLVPSWPPGCRRITPGDGYLEALVKPNVTTVHKEIAQVVPNGIIDSSGQLHEVDILACATGFNLAFIPRFEVRGVNGIKMSDAFTPEPRVYLSVTVPKFPNYFIVNGVRGQWASGTALPAHEISIEYILKCAKKIQGDGIRALEVKDEAVTQLYEHIDAWHQGSVWNAHCKSWYKNNISGGKLWIWAGSALHYVKTMMEPRYEHYNMRYWNSNMFAFLGNGRVEAEYLAQIGALTGSDMNARLAPYLRNEDVPFEI